jgi:hypothetical protein
LRTCLNSCCLVCVQENNDSCTNLLQHNCMVSVKRGNLNVNEGTFISHLQTVNIPVELQYEEFIKRNCRLKSASKKCTFLIT